MKATVFGLVVLGLIAAVAVSVVVALMRVDPVVEQAEAPKVVDVEIAVAERDLPAGAVVDAASVQLKAVEQGNMPAGAIRGPEKVIGRVLIAPMAKGQVFTPSNFASDSSGLRLAAVIPEGMRAMSVTLNESAAMDGMLYPGSLVDVIASFQAVGLEEDSNRRETMSTILLEGIQVLGVHDRTVVSNRDQQDESGSASRTSSRRQMVTLLVNGKQAEALQLAAAHGSISLALRNPLDATAGYIERGTLFSDLSRFYSDRVAAARRVEVAQAEPAPLPVVQVVEAKPEPEPRPKPAAKPAPQARWTTVVMRGTTEQKLEFAMDEK